MKRLPFILIAAVLAGITLNSCLFKSDDEKYEEWRKANEEWYARQVNLVDVDGRSYYTLQSAPWDPNAQVLMHWFNDTMLTRENLKPLYTSTVDVKYSMTLYDDSFQQNSFSNTSPADSIYRCRINNQIEGWAIALTKMHIGDSVRVVIPYNVGYGAVVYSTMKPYTMLQYDIKLVGIPAYETK